MSTRNRRNYYRVLYVQPEAPTEVIKASYRALMGTLRRHPDLGGDHEQAALLNEAYAVLTDPARRADYDQRYSARYLRGPRPGVPGMANAPTPAATASPASTSAPPAPLSACPVCAAALPARIDVHTRCTTCGGPLAPPPRTASQASELFGRRGHTRRPKDHEVQLRWGWPAREMTVRWRDLSLGGLSVLAPQPLPEGGVVRLLDPALDAVAAVVSCRASGAAYAVHARMITADFLHARG